MEEAFSKPAGAGVEASITSAGRKKEEKRMVRVGGIHDDVTHPAEALIAVSGFTNGVFTTRCTILR